MSDMNLVVYLARAGVGSRRACDELIRVGKVMVNDEAITFPRNKVKPDDVVTVDGEPVEVKQLRYLLVNKPRGVASTRRDPHAEKVIVDMVPNGRILFPVGRLDVETTGLLILTNDGALANRLMHPRYGVPKTYVARVRGKISKRTMAMLREGVLLEDGMTSPAEVRLEKQSGKSALVEITIHEGRKRQVRRMFDTVGHRVDELHRRRYGPLSDKGLNIGSHRQLSGDEIDALRKASEEVVRSLATEVEGEPLTLSNEVAPPPVEAPLLSNADFAEPVAEEESADVVEPTDADAAADAAADEAADDAEPADPLT